MKQRLLTALLTLATLLMLMPVGALAVEPGAGENDSEIFITHPGIGGVEDVIPLSELPSTFGLTSGVAYNQSFYNQLDSVSKKIYDAIYSSELKDGPTMDDIPLSGVSYSELGSEGEAVAAAIAALVYDHPELSWLINTQWGIRSSGTSALFYMSESGYKHATNDPTMDAPDYSYADTKDRTVIANAIASAKSKIGTLSGKSNYEKVKVIYDWICNNIEYWEEGTTWPINWRGYQTVYSALVEGVTVCAGYSKAFKLLCDEYNIPCAIVAGKGGGSGTPQGWGPHAWNYVQMDDGKWYAVDSTWGDQSTWIDYDYLLMGSDKFYNTHEEGSLYDIFAFSYPELSTEDYKDEGAPDTIELSCTLAWDGISEGYPYYVVPTISSMGTQTTKDSVFTAKLKKGDSIISGKTVDWVLSGLGGNKDGITLTPNSDGTATLSISNAALSAINPEMGYTGPIVTITAKCGSVQKSQEFLIFVSHRSATFVQIQKDGSAIPSDTLQAGSTAAYTAKVYDQYGQEMSGQTVSWSVTGAGVTVSNGAVTVADNAAGDYTVTAACGSGRADLTITVEHTHNFSEWSGDETNHWHVCEACGAESPDKESHTWDGGNITTPPTNTAEGIKTSECTVCKRTKTESINPLAPNTVYVHISSADARDVEVYGAESLLPENAKIFAAQYENGKMKGILAGTLLPDDNGGHKVRFTRELASGWQLFFLGENHVPIFKKAALYIVGEKTI